MLSEMNEYATDRGDSCGAMSTSAGKVGSGDKPAGIKLKLFPMTRTIEYDLESLSLALSVKITETVDSSTGPVRLL